GDTSPARRRPPPVGFPDLVVFTMGGCCMAARLIVSEAPDLTTIQVVGRLRDDAVALLGEACHRARRPLVLDLSELTGASEAGVILLGQLAGQGVHLLGASHYLKLLLERTDEPPRAPTPRRRSPRKGDEGMPARESKRGPRRPGRPSLLLALAVGAMAWAGPVAADDAPASPPLPPLERLFAPLKERMTDLTPFLRDTDLKVHFRSYYFDR